MTCLFFPDWQNYASIELIQNSGKAIFHNNQAVSASVLILYFLFSMSKKVFEPEPEYLNVLCFVIMMALL